jgi:fused signal recognition particle receptor
MAWGERNNVTVIAQQGGDAAAVCYDAIQAATARGIDIVLADTAGRLPTQLHLMEEIKKVKRVIQKALPDAPHEVILVLDANIGQNAISQVKVFDDALPDRPDPDQAGWHRQRRRDCRHCQATPDSATVCRRG